jgi:membrane-associated phospholipid phosphatase
VIHILLPAAGPVFFERLGYGPNFSGIAVPGEMTDVSDYLWAVYQDDQFGPGSGISAMPSLHIATTAWIIIAMSALCRRMAAPAVGFGILIFLLSISLGWHYAIDGIVGGAAALGCFALCLRMYEGKMKVPSWLRPGPIQRAPADAAVD